MIGVFAVSYSLDDYATNNIQTPTPDIQALTKSLCCCENQLNQKSLEAMQNLANVIAKELETAKHCAVYQPELIRV